MYIFPPGFKGHPSNGCLRRVQRLTVASERWVRCSAHYWHLYVRQPNSVKNFTGACTWGDPRLLNSPQIAQTCSRSGDSFPATVCGKFTKSLVQHVQSASQCWYS